MRSHTLIAAVTAGLACSAALLASLDPPGSAAAQQGGGAVTAAPDVAHLFDPIAETVRHPRCMNCHTTTNWPRQGDERHPHLFNVARGPDDHGVPGMQCSACHGEANNDVGGVPGAPHWGLAPLSMAWEYMTAPQLCAQIKDPERNGGKTLAELHEHMTADLLVLWAWEPGLHPDGTARTPPPHDLPAWRAAMTAWVDAGAPCPGEGD